MSLAREIKDLAIALEALTRVPKSDSVTEQIDLLMCQKIDQLRTETQERSNEDFEKALSTIIAR